MLGSCVSPAFLSILPAAGDAAAQVLRWRAWAPFLGDGEASSLKARFPSKAPAGRRQNHNLTILGWSSRHPASPGFQDVWLKDRVCKAEDSSGDPCRGRGGGPQHQLAPALCLR